MSRMTDGSYIQKASKMLVGYCVCREVQIGVDANACRLVLVRHIQGNKPHHVVSHYMFRGKLRTFPDFLNKFIGWNLVVRFDEFSIRCKLLDNDGNVESVEAPSSPLPPEEIWKACGGTL